MKLTGLTFILLCFFIVDGYSQVVEYPKHIEWNKAGAVTNFPEPSEADSIFYVPPPDSVSDWENIQAAIDAAGAAEGINLVIIQEGIYILNKPLVLEAGIHDNVYIKGAGPNHLMNAGPRTILNFDFTNPADFRISAYGNVNTGIAFKGGSEAFLGAILGYDPSTNQVTISGSSLGISTGDIIRIRSNKHRISCKVHPCMGQINKVKNVLNHIPLVVELEHDFSLTWDQQAVYGGINLEVHKIYALQNVGISSLGMETIGYKSDPLPDHFVCKDEPSANHSPHGHHILMFRVYNAQVNDLYSYRPIAHHVYMIEALHNTISDSFFDEAIYRHGCFGGHGYGVNLWRKNTLNLVENNIFRKMRRALMFSRAAHKNVIGYNYSREVFAQTGHPDRGDLSSRNMSDSGNLAEGNRLDRIMNDNYHEEKYTAYKNIYFRNFTYYNFIENEGGIETYFIGNKGEFTSKTIPSTIISDAYGFLDSKLLPHPTDLNKVFPNTEAYLNMTSLYYNEVPHFFLQKDLWNQSYSWPSVGPRLHAQDQMLIQDIPARGRFCAAYNDFSDSSYHCDGYQATPLPASLMKPVSVEN